MPKLKNSACRCDAPGHQRSARKLDHRPDQIVDARALLLEHRSGDPLDQRPDDPKLGLGRDQRHHDLGDRRVARAALLRDRNRGLEDRPRLHLVNLGIGDSEPAAAMAEHRVELVKLLDPAREQIGRDPDRRGDVLMLAGILGQEFVERRVEQSDRDRQARHDPENLLEVRCAGPGADRRARPGGRPRPRPGSSAGRW